MDKNEPNYKSQKDLYALITKLGYIAAGLPSGVKTMNKHDFTGYGKDTLQKSLDHLGAGSLPGPLKLVRDALERAMELVDEDTK